MSQATPTRSKSVRPAAGKEAAAAAGQTAEDALLQARICRVTEYDLVDKRVILSNPPSHSNQEGGGHASTAAAVEPRRVSPSLEAGNDVPTAAADHAADRRDNGDDALDPGRHAIAATLFGDDARAERWPS